MLTRMKAIRIGTIIDDAVVRAIPALSPLLGRHVELIALDETMVDTTSKLSVAELLAARTKLPPGLGPLTQDDIDRAIADGAAGR